MDRYIATMVANDTNGFDVSVGRVGWSAQPLGTIEGGTGMFDRAEQLLTEHGGWRAVGDESWTAVPGSNDDVFVVAVEQ